MNRKGSEAIMHRLTKCLVDYCRQNFVLQESAITDYQSLSVCLIDCVYSLRAKYYRVTLPIVKRYADIYMDGNIESPRDTVSNLIQHIEECGGPKAFADHVLENHQELGGKAHIPKENALLQLATYLKQLHIETIDDFRNFELPELLENVIRAVKGMGDAGTNYLFMLAGDPNRCKPDVHIHQCIIDACCEDVTNEECQILFQETAEIFKTEYPTLTVRGLDGIIWRYYQAKQ